MTKMCGRNTSSLRLSLILSVLLFFVHTSPSLYTVSSASVSSDGHEAHDPKDASDEKHQELFANAPDGDSGTQDLRQSATTAKNVQTTKGDNGGEQPRTKHRFAMMCARLPNSAKNYDSCIAYFPSLYQISKSDCASARENEWYFLRDRIESACVPVAPNVTTAQYLVPVEYSPKCDLATQIRNIMEAGGKGVLFVSHNNSVPQFPEPGIEFDIPVMVAGVSSYSKMLSFKKRGGKFHPWDMETEERFPPGLLLIWVFAMFSITVGAYWSGVTRQKLHQEAQNPAPAVASSTSNGSSSANSQTGRNSLTVPLTNERNRTRRPQDREEPFIKIPVVGIFAIVASMCVMLILLYFFMHLLVWVVIALYMIGTATAVYQCFYALMKRVPYGTCNFPCTIRSYTWEVRRGILAMIAIALPIVWVIYRKEKWSWMLQDFLGICFSINMLRIFRFSSLRLITIFLSLLLIYDVFFVFITPFFTGDGISIMVQVAVGGGDSVMDGIPVEQLPLVLKVPPFVPNPCFEHYNLLGFGDILVPGLVPSYGYAFDLQRKSRVPIYYLAGLIAYAGGLCITFAAVFFMQVAQPALLYLVPCTLIVALLTALWRREFHDVWRGTVWDEEKNPLQRPLPGPTAEEERPPSKNENNGEESGEEGRRPT